MTRGSLENLCTARGDAREVWWSSPGRGICTSQCSTRHFWVLLVLFQIPTRFGEGKEGGVKVWLCILQGAGCCGTQLLGDFPNCGAAAEGLGAGSTVPASPNCQLSAETLSDRRVKEERCRQAALILRGEAVSADSYLGTRRYQNP